jgi:hypothetical protein
MAALKPDPWHDNYAEVASKKEGRPASTYKAHVSHLNSLRRMFGGITACKIIALGRLGASVILKAMQKGSVADCTLKNRVSALMSVVKLMAPPEFQELAAPQIAAWEAIHRWVAARAKAPMSQHRATKKQVEGHVPWLELLAARDALPLLSPGRLLLEMYTRVPPLRLDYKRMKVVWLDPCTRSFHLGGWAGNYMVLDPAGQSSFYHVLRPNKKKEDPVYAAGIKGHVPPELQAVIRASLEAHPRDYLFTQQKTNKTFKNELYRCKDDSSCSFSRFACKELKAAVGNASTDMHLLRRLYVVQMYKVYKAALSGEMGEEAQAHAQQQVRASAHLMAHSVSTHALYRFDVDAGEKAVEFERLTKFKLPVLGAVSRAQPLEVEQI